MTKSTQTLSNEILSNLTTFMKYAKYLPEHSRRETWEELATRNMEMHIRKFPQLEDSIREVYRDFVMTKKVLPSMRSMQFGGRPIEVNNVRIFNCSFVQAKDWEVFHESMFLLLSGTGVGYSVQRHHVEQLPAITTPGRARRYLIGDSIEGWADSVKVLIKAYLFGKFLPRFDYRDIREKGAKLVTSGGKAPGPEPLRICLEKLEALLRSKQPGEQLTTVEVHDMLCIIADAVLAGGIRRAALISLFTHGDEDMLRAKSNFPIVSLEPVDGESRNVAGEYKVVVDEPGYGEQTHFLNLSEWDLAQLGTMEEPALPWWHFRPHRGRANNSVVLLRGTVTEAEFNRLWKMVEASNAGEPGIFWTNDLELGTNPCAEISLVNAQFCNLTETNASDADTQEELNARVKAGAFIGTLQAAVTDFHYLRPMWRENTEKEALLGVSMTGIASGAVLKLDLGEAAQVALEENARVAAILGINPAARVTTVKPAGTTSLVLGTSSGIHAWHAPYYIRRVRVGKNEALYEFLSMFHPELVEDDKFSASQAVISIPQKAPDGAIYRDESALNLLERIKLFQLEWIQKGHRTGNNFHNVSATISVGTDEWDAVGEWMWREKDNYTGLSCLPRDNGSYLQAPFEDTTEEVYNEMMKSLTSLDLTELIETEDVTDLQSEAACASGGCEVK